MELVHFFIRESPVIVSVSESESHALLVLSHLRSSVDVEKLNVLQDFSSCGSYNFLYIAYCHGLVNCQSYVS